MKKKKNENYEIEVANRNDLRDLEQSFINDKVSNMMTAVEAKKEELVKEMIVYAEKNTKPCKWNKEGDPIAYKTIVNPLIINNYFFNFLHC